MKPFSTMKVKVSVRANNPCDILTRLAKRIDGEIVKDSWRTRYFSRLLAMYVKILNRRIQKRKHVPDMLSTIGQDDLDESQPQNAVVQIAQSKQEVIPQIKCHLDEGHETLSN